MANSERELGHRRAHARPLRFDGRTAIVTGAGGKPGLGRAHALLLAARGANVVVNDVDHDPRSNSQLAPASAEAVAREIREAGGAAVACVQSVATAEGAARIVAAALEAFGGLDILVNNAAVSVAAPFDVMTPDDFRRHIDVNLMGSYHMCRAAWPHMKSRGYGRIVNTTSAAMTGFSDQAAYAASKGGVWSLTRALAAEGRAHGILVNAASPGAYTRLVASMLEPDSPLLQYSQQQLPADLSSPAVTFLCHEVCPVSGECIDSVGGEVQRSFIGRTRGFRDPALSIESVADHWDEVMAQQDFQTVGIAAFDTAEWKLRPYIAPR
jgi:NAD(P)-dependent dehydrogenase (short-subunit alcohol dehydrogenase family)